VRRMDANALFDFSSSSNWTPERTRPSNRIPKRSFSTLQTLPPQHQDVTSPSRSGGKRAKESRTQAVEGAVVPRCQPGGGSQRVGKDAFQVHCHDTLVKIVDVRASFEAALKQADLEEEMRKLEKGCRCVKTKCLKQYCACFRNDTRCSAECCCKDCANDGEHEEERMQAIKITRLNDPSAFKGTTLQLHEIEVQAVDGSRKTVKGCRCTRSKCLKKYCECYGAGLKCSVNCVCEDCRNMPGSSGPQKPPKAGQAVGSGKSSGVKKGGSKGSGIVVPGKVEAGAKRQLPVPCAAKVKVKKVSKPVKKKIESNGTHQNLAHKALAHQALVHHFQTHEGAQHGAEPANNDNLYPEVPDTPETVFKNEECSVAPPPPAAAKEDFYAGMMYDPASEVHYPQQVAAAPSAPYRYAAQPQGLHRQSRHGWDGDELAAGCWVDEEGVWRGGLGAGGSNAWGTDGLSGWGPDQRRTAATAPVPDCGRAVEAMYHTDWVNVPRPVQSSMDKQMWQSVGGRAMASPPQKSNFMYGGPRYSTATVPKRRSLILSSRLFPGRHSLLIPYKCPHSNHRSPMMGGFDELYNSNPINPIGWNDAGRTSDAIFMASGTLSRQTSEDMSELFRS